MSIRNPHFTSNNFKKNGDQYFWNCFQSLIEVPPAGFENFPEKVFNLFSNLVANPIEIPSAGFEKP